jgi:hypothetical protein
MIFVYAQKALKSPSQLFFDLHSILNLLLVHLLRTPASTEILAGLAHSCYLYLATASFFFSFSRFDVLL